MIKSLLILFYHIYINSRKFPTFFCFKSSSSHALMQETIFHGLIVKIKFLVQDISHKCRNHSFIKVLFPLSLEPS